MSHLIFGLFKTLIAISITTCVCNASFKVSVIEYQEDYSKYYTPATYATKNSEDYADIISQVAREGSGLTVFPENSFAYHDVFQIEKNQLAAYAFRIPNPGARVNLCTLPEPNRYKKALVKVSCAAKENHIFVVMNLLEMVEDYIFSTNIVFDKEGYIIARCRKDLYTGKQLEQLDLQNCSFTANDFEFSLLMENDIFSTNVDQFIGNKKNVIYTTHRAINNTIFLNVPLYQKFRAAHELDNLLVAAKHSNDENHGLTGTGIFTRWESNIFQAEELHKSHAVYQHLGFKPIRSRTFRHTEDGVSVSRYIKHFNDFTIMDLKPDENNYAADGLSCKIKVQDASTPSHYKVGILNVNKNVSSVPAYDNLRESTMHTIKFCGIISCNRLSCGEVLPSIPEIPRVTIEMNTKTTQMTPFIIDHDLNYKEANHPQSQLMENSDISGYVFGFINEQVKYERIVRKVDIQPTFENYMSFNGSTKPAWAAWSLLIVILITFL